MIAVSRSGPTIAPLHKGERSGTNNPLIHKLQGLADLTAADIAALETITSQTRMFGPHVDLIREGEAPEAFLIVLEGFACRYKQRQTGARQITAYLLPGDVCDIDAADLAPLDHAVGTLAPCVVARVSRQAMADLMQQHPNIAQALRRIARVEIATARAWIVNVGCRSALERMAHLFCELMTRFEAVGLGRYDTCPLPLTQGDLAQTLGLSNVHANRTVQELRRQGLIELKGKNLRLLDLPRLRQIAEFSPGYLQPRPARHAY